MSERMRADRTALASPALAPVLAIGACVVFAAAACGPSNTTTMECFFDGSPEQLAERPSPPDSVLLVEGGRLVAKLCYSRPSARGRVVFGELEPYDTLWRTGANEPTVIHLTTAAVIAGMPVEPGQYSIYTVPSAGQWRVVVNASTSQWGLTHDAIGADGVQYYNAYTDDVRRREVGRAPIDTEEIADVETLTAHFEPDGADRYRLLFDWQNTRIVIPVQLVRPTP